MKLCFKISDKIWERVRISLNQFFQQLKQTKPKSKRAPVAWRIRGRAISTGSQQLQSKLVKSLHDVCDFLLKNYLQTNQKKDIEEIVNEGNKSRTVAATNMNAESSRSHAVFCVKVSQNIVDTESGVSCSHSFT